MSNRSELRTAIEVVSRFLAARGVLFHQTVAQRAGIATSDLNCLNILEMDGPLTTGGLAERAGLTKGGAITAALDRLERAGMVLRDSDPGDRRRVIVRHTEHALQIIEPLMSPFNVAWAKIVDSYTDDELCVLLDYLERNDKAMLDMMTMLQGADKG